MVGILYKSTFLHSNRLKKMPYLLEQFERVVEYIGNPKNCGVKFQFENEKQFVYSISLFDLKQGLLLLAASKALPGIVCQQVRLYQSSSIRMLKHLHDRPDCCCFSARCWGDIFYGVVNTLISFINFLHIQFPEYFDKELIAPALYYDYYRVRFKDKVEKILKLKVDAEKLESIKKVVDYFKELGYTNCSFRRIWYIDKLLTKINTKICNEHVMGDKFEELVKLIISYNFNSTEVYHQIIEWIKRDLAMGTNVNAVLEKLQCYKKQVSQIMVIKGDGFSRKSKKLKISIINWINKEMNSFNYHVHIFDEVKKVKEPEQLYIRPQKIQTNLSVAEIACVLRQFIEVGIIYADNKKEIFRLVSEIFASKHNHQISYKSLNNNFFNIELSTYKSTKQLFLKLFRSIEE
ncbi:hypothetical protein JCM21142_114621 [Saccharicrinis fermentans DSM 9555 = JCM 21142]|uniref:Uncharacterized protein n=2 Tax=Saccharicrinis fermentans TaxID=982 RepID=W7YTU5_9BACT|nr:hypothetical protein JCM21142_114621 [Saccharicrinis fermentans DSM 9555 = JCM 21142]